MSVFPYQPSLYETVSIISNWRNCLGGHHGREGRENRTDSRREGCSLDDPDSELSRTKPLDNPTYLDLRGCHTGS
jgi:hypothetical protein